MKYWNPDFQEQNLMPLESIPGLFAMFLIGADLLSLAEIIEKFKNQLRYLSMVAYEFYWRDETGKVHFIGILPERRKDPRRITEKSIMNWGREVIGDNTKIRDIFFTQIKID